MGMPATHRRWTTATQRIDRVVKRDFYLDNGVSEYWIVDADARVIERVTTMLTNY